MDIRLSKVQIIFFLGIFYFLIPLGLLSIKFNPLILPVAISIWAILIWKLRFKQKLIPKYNSRNPFERYPEIKFIKKMKFSKFLKLTLIAFIILTSSILLNLVFLAIYIKYLE